MTKSLKDIDGKKIFVLDTNILAEDPQAILNLKDNCIIVAFSVLDELDGLKKRRDELGANARRASRFINKTITNRKHRDKGIELESGGILFLDNEEGIHDSPPLKIHNDTADHRILSVAMKWQKHNPHLPVILISNDTNLRTKADSFEIKAEGYKTNKISGKYLGFKEINNAKLFDALSGKNAPPDDILQIDEKPYPNEGLIVKNKNESLLAMYYGSSKIKKLGVPKSIYGIKPKNQLQELAFGVLLDPNISIVSLEGKAGTGKTLIALAAALEMFEKDQYEKIAVARPIVTMGNDVGYLPGDLEAKLNPWVQPIYDNLDIIFSAKASEHKTSKASRQDWRELTEKGFLCIEPLAYIRGRSMPNQILIIDEAQNLNRLEIKTIITRVGEGTKIIFTGDINQIDNPYLDQNNNGLSVVIDKFKDKDCAGHITLVKSERSKVAELAANIL